MCRVQQQFLHSYCSQCVELVGVRQRGLTSPVMDGIRGHEATEWGPDPHLEAEHTPHYSKDVACKLWPKG